MRHSQWFGFKKIFRREIKTILSPFVILMISVKGCMAVINLEATTSVQQFYSHSEFGKQNYPGNYSQQWRIHTNYENHTIQVTLGECGIEFTVGKNGERFCSWSYDLLVFYDVDKAGNDTVLTYMESSCCNNSIIDLRSKGPDMEIHFITDSSSQYEGFRIEYVTYGPLPSVAISQRKEETQINTAGVVTGVLLALIALIIVVIVIIWLVTRKMKKNQPMEAEKKLRYRKSSVVHPMPTTSNKGC